MKISSKNRATKAVYHICGRHRLIAVLAITAAIWAMPAAVSFLKEDRELKRFDLLRVGMERAEVVRIVGEPEFKSRVEEWGEFPSEIRAKRPELIEYGYSVGSSWDSAYLEISGIYLGKDEKRIVFLNRRLAIVELDRSWVMGLLAIAGLLALAALIWRLLAMLCKKARPSTEISP
jgi:hypothetical protein